MRVIIFLSLFVVYQVYGQKTPFDRVPPSPNAASIGRYSLAPVNLSSGSISPNVKLFEIDEYGLPLDISANYSYRGYRPSELTGILGNGWNLLAGGTITRTVNSKKDERSNAGYYHIGSEIQTAIDQFQATQVPNSLMAEITYGNIDSEPDLFNFSFGSNSGSFFFGADGKIHIVSQSKLAIKAEYSPNPIPIHAALHNVLDNFVGFSITTEDGTIYKFYAVEYSRSTSEKGEQSGFNDDGVRGKLISAWHLTEIIGTGGQKIKLEYTDSPASANRAQFTPVESFFAYVPSPSWLQSSITNYADVNINISYEVYLKKSQEMAGKLN